MARRRSLAVSPTRPLSLVEYSSTQAEGRRAPPTRPRSWCSWLRPKRSACSMTMSEALGTSTPTSITVVLTSTPIWPLEKLHHGLLLCRGHARVQQAHHHAGQGLAQIGVRGGGVAQVQRLAFSSISGHTQYTCRPASTCADALDHLVLAAVGDQFGDDGACALAATRR